MKAFILSTAPDKEPAHFKNEPAFIWHAEKKTIIS
jgi:hypothetical protein